jgi:hypothetical protein
VSLCGRNDEAVAEFWACVTDGADAAQITTAAGRPAWAGSGGTTTYPTTREGAGAGHWTSYDWLLVQYNHLTVTGLVQYLVDTYNGLANGSHVNFFFCGDETENNQENGLYAQEDPSATDPYLTITYTAGGESGSGSGYESGSGSGYPEDHELVIADMTLALTFDGLALIQNHALAVADMAMALNLEALALVQNHALTIADVAMALGFEAPVLTQAHLLVVDDVAMGLEFGSPALVQAHVLVMDDMVCALSFEAPTLSQDHLLVISDMAMALEFDVPALVQDHPLSVADMSLALILDAFNIAQAQVLVVDDMTLELLFDSITLPGTPVVPGPVVPGAGTPCGTWASRDRCGLVGPKIRYLGKKCGLVGTKPKRCED